VTGAAPWQPRPVSMRVLDGRVMTAGYYKHEELEFARMRAEGLPDDELRFMHELKATFDATLDIVVPSRTMVALIDEREHFRRRNTSAVRVVARADAYRDLDDDVPVDPPVDPQLRLP
jgi:hypothetical protein